MASELKKKVADVQMLNVAPELNAHDASAVANIAKEIGILKHNIENSSKIVDENGEPGPSPSTPATVSEGCSTIVLQCS